MYAKDAEGVSDYLMDLFLVFQMILLLPILKKDHTLTRLVEHGVILKRQQTATIM